MEADKNFIVGVFDDEEAVMNGIRKVRENGVKIHDVFSPFPVHGIDEALGLKRSRLPIAAFLFGLTSCNAGCVDGGAGTRSITGVQAGARVLRCQQQGSYPRTGVWSCAP